MAAHDWPENHRATAELWRAAAALARPAGTLLLVGLGGGAADVADALGLVRACTALGELPIDDPRENVAAHRQAEHFVGEIDIADFLVVEVVDLELHTAPPSSALASVSGVWTSSASGSAADSSGPAAACSSPRSAAGNGRSAGARRLTASRTRTQPPALPGTAPRTMRTPRSTSAAITSRFKVVTRSAPM